MMRALCRLSRLRLALLNGVAAVGGFLLFPAPAKHWQLLAVFAGVTLLAAAGSALNQVMERDLDLLMTRTRHRPLPAGELTPNVAMAIGGVFLVGGLLLVGVAGGWLPALLGGAALAWYLGVYTPLKRRTSLALAIGALSGALPPVIGWCSAGGNPADYRVLFLAGLLYLWQIPHFWLLQLRHGDDYRRAGIPVFTPHMGDVKSFALCRLWLVALVAGGMLLPAFGLIEPLMSLCYTLPAAILICMLRNRSVTALSACLNLFLLLVTMALLVGK